MLQEELHFGYQLTGSLVCARGAEEEEHLEELLARGATNGVANLRIVRGAELKEMEPNISPEITAALHSPDAGTLIPYEYTIALAENAVDNGVEVRPTALSDSHSNYKLIIKVLVRWRREARSAGIRRRSASSSSAGSTLSAGGA